MGGGAVLVLDDDRQSLWQVRLYLSNCDYDVEVVSGVDEVFGKLTAENPDLVLIDPAMPGIGGFGICQKIRGMSDVPFIVVSAASDDATRIVSLEAGADDFIVKPFNPQELVARVKAVLRRARAWPRPKRVLSIGDVIIDAAKREIVAGNHVVSLRAKELGILQLLASQPGVVVPRKHILQAIWGPDFVGDERTLTVHVAWLRAKLVGSCVRVLGVRGLGYKLVTD